MCATKTSDIDATARMASALAEAGAGLVRVAVDTKRDAEALHEIALRTPVRLSVDLHENHKLAELVAPFVKKIRYNPGHLHHIDPEIPWRDKVKRIADIAGEHGCALRIGVNCGSLAPDKKSRDDGSIDTMPLLISTLEHAEFLDSLGFINFCVSLKSSDPHMVIRANREFARRRPDVPIHLGLTEAGMPPEAVLKSRAALEPLLADGIGDTLRVSLTVPNARKAEEIEAGRLILTNVAAGDILTPDQLLLPRLNIISCPSCARVENGAFVELAETIREATRFATDFPVNIAVMGCRVNGPGETDKADLGIWCGTHQANLKRGETLIGAFDYDQIVPRLIEELRRLMDGQ
jgi:(E)-4-hydroxy-3-methylbut-2-enyl-diphosphate synthase